MRFLMLRRSRQAPVEELLLLEGVSAEAVDVSVVDGALLVSSADEAEV